LFDNLRTAPTRLSIKPTTVATSLILCSKTHVTVCLHCCRWRNPWCHSQVKPVTSQWLAA